MTHANDIEGGKEKQHWCRMTDQISFSKVLNLYNIVKITAILIVQTEVLQFEKITFNWMLSFSIKKLIKLLRIMRLINMLHTLIECSVSYLVTLLFDFLKWKFSHQIIHNNKAVAPNHSLFQSYYDRSHNVQISKAIGFSAHFRTPHQNENFRKQWR